MVVIASRRRRERWKVLSSKRNPTKTSSGRTLKLFICNFLYFSPILQLETNNPYNIIIINNNMCSVSSVVRLLMMMMMIFLLLRCCCYYCCFVFFTKQLVASAAAIEGDAPFLALILSSPSVSPLERQMETQPDHRSSPLLIKDVLYKVCQFLDFSSDVLLRLSIVSREVFVLISSFEDLVIDVRNMASKDVAKHDWLLAT